MGAFVRYCRGPAGMCIPKMLEETPVLLFLPILHNARLPFRINQYKPRYPTTCTFMIRISIFAVLFLSVSFLLAQSSNGTVVTSQAIASNQGALTGPLQSYDAFGRSIAVLGDLDGDGIDDIAVGAPGRSSNSPTDGALWVLFLNADGTVKAEQKIADNLGGFSGDLTGQEALGHGLAYLGDLDGDGRPELAVGAPGNIDASGQNPADSGAVYILSLNTDGTVHSQTLIRNNSGGLPGLTLDRGEHFGYSVANAGDLNGDGRPELAVGSWGFNNSRGALYILFLNTDGTVNTFQRISETEGNFNRVLSTNDHFGCSIASIDDINGDDIPDLAVGAYGTDEGGSFRGAVWFLRMQPDGTVNDGSSIIDGAHHQLVDTLSDFDYFGWSVGKAGDLDGDGRSEVVVGAPRTNTAGSGSGEGRIFILFTGGGSILRGFATISEDEGNLNQPLSTFAGFGSALANPGDIDGDGIDDLWVGAYGFNGGVSGTGGIFRLLLEGKGEAQLQGRAMVYPNGLVQPVTAGKAYLFDLYDEDPDLFGHDTTAQATLNSSGEFTFVDLPLRDYYLKVVPESDTLVGGYYVEDLLQRPYGYWRKSVLKILGDTVVEDIFIRKTAKPSTGTVMYGVSYRAPGKGESFSTFGDPAEAIPIFIRPAGTDSLLDNAISNSEGAFRLSGLQEGASYDLLVDVPGLPMDSATAIGFVYPAGKDSLEIEILIDTAAIFVNFNPTTSIKENIIQQWDIVLGPVPVQDQLMVNWKGNSQEAISYRVVDLQGRTVTYSEGFRGQPSYLDLGQAAPGAYLLEARTESGMWIKKFIKQ